MNIISVDLPWKSETKGRTAIVIADLDGNVKIERASDDNGLLELVRKYADPETHVLLDIPIEGCQNLENLKGKRFRPVDKAIYHQGIGLFPSYRAGDRGKELKECLERQSKGIIVQEIYPYAVYKFLWYAQEKGKLPHSGDSDFIRLLDEEFKKRWPPRYKRAAGEERQQAMRFLYSLLTDPAISLSGLDNPGSLSIARLGDEYDACLGAVVGLYWVKRSKYACLAGNPQEGEILLLADQWLRTELEKKEILVRNNEEGVEL
jgi:predicted nuclease with RNAse H fold